MWKAWFSFVLGQYCLWAVIGQPTYTYPPKFQAQVHGCVTDSFLNGKTACSTGWTFNDYSINGTRIDEVWNHTSIIGTDLEEILFIADTHLSVGSQTFFIYANATGLHCSASFGSNTVPQDAFSHPSSWVNETIFNGIKVNHFKTVFSGVFPYHLYVTVDTNLPVRAYIPPTKAFGFTLSTEIFYDSFEAVDSFPVKARLFDVPSPCSISSNGEKKQAKLKRPVPSGFGLSIPSFNYHPKQAFD